MGAGSPAAPVGMTGAKAYDPAAAGVDAAQNSDSSDQDSEK